VKDESQVLHTVADSPPRGWRLWWIAARPKTLTIAIAPVIVGCALAWAEGATPALLPAIVALFSALLIQAGTNLHNDLADFERGNDRPDRIGPPRVTAFGWAPPQAVRRAMVVAFGAAIACGVYLIAVGGWPILVVGVVSIIAGWAYSGGPRPIAYTPLGEIFVLAFFGLVAVAGSYYLQSGRLTVSALLASVAVGAPAAAVLMVNNYRDIETDLAAGRRTLAALLGRAAARKVYAILMLVPFAFAVRLAWPDHPGALLTLLVLPYGVALARRLGQSASAANRGGVLNDLLAGTARMQFLFSILLALGVNL
jgi:1,4-dihydroxy-2-naphthoate polyprenyltransferase